MNQVGKIENQPVVKMQKLMKPFCFSVVLVTALFIGFTDPWAPELTPIGHKVLMGLLITIGLWIFKPANIPFSVSGCLLMMILLAYGIPSNKVFSGFTSSALWTLIPALYFGYVLAKTGLGKRIAYLVMKMFNPSYKSLIIAWVIIGVVLSILTPSITVRVAIVMPIAVSCIEVCRLQGKSNGGALILLTAWSMALLPGTGWLTGSLWGPIVMGMYNSIPDLNGLITFNTWFKVSFLPLELVTLLLIIGGYFAFKPKKDINMTKAAFEEEYINLGKLSKDEKYTAIILTACFAMFLTNQLHHLPDAAIVLGGLFALTATGVIKTPELSQGISWDLVIFIGVAMGLGTVFAEVGVSQWLAVVLVPFIEPIASNPWLFVFGITAFLFLWRFIDVAILIPTMAILIPVIPVISQNFSINPLIWTTIFVMVGNCFFLSYQNMFTLVGEAIAGDKGWAPGQLSKYGFIYLFACIISLLITVPYWMSIGMFK